MPDEGQVISGINWRDAFPFTHIFRSFRIAIHPSKLALGLALLFTVYIGGRLLDLGWRLTRSRAIPGEIAEYQRISKGEDQITLSEWRAQEQDRLDRDLADQFIEYRIIVQGPNETYEQAQARALTDVQSGADLSKLKDAIYARRDAQAQQILSDNTLSAQAKKDQIRSAYQDAAYRWHDIEMGRGAGLFNTFFQYEVRQVTGVVDGVLHNNWIGDDGVTEHAEQFLGVGPVWLILHHTIFFLLFAILFLLAWAVFGGAICRIAAVHVARDEKISLRQAMNFAAGKVLSFASAPVIPLAIVIVIGLAVGVVSLIGNIPFAGPIVLGALFIFALIAGAVMTLVLLGTGGGFNLMYPTIAVEGSDSFDAISRSFSYVYARPWRMLFYTIVGVAYGAATYIFVHMFIELSLVLTHHFVGMGMYDVAKNKSDLFSTMWPNPASVGRLSYTPDYAALNPAEQIGALLMNCWVMFMVSFLGAFAISLYFSANTVIYFLMRGEVDQTEMDDVYLEQSEEELEPALNSPPATVVVTTEVASAEQTSDPNAGGPA
jgi:hypothetical protein